jgi:hypothetical protein
MTPEEFIQHVTKMRDEAAAKVKRLKDADGEDEFSELNYYNGQKVALNQVLSWYNSLKTIEYPQQEPQTENNFSDGLD